MPEATATRTRPVLGVSSVDRDVMLPGEHWLTAVPRFFCYTALFFLVLALLPRFAAPGDISDFREGAVVENLQLTILAIASIIAFGAGKVRSGSPLLLLLSGLTLIALIRELDRWLDLVIPLVGWQGPAVAALLVSVIMVWKDKSTLLSEFKAFCSGRSFGVLWAGAIVAVPFAQLVGHSDFLEAIMGDDYDRSYKRVIEETGEFAGYLIIALGIFETVLDVRRRRILRELQRESAEAQ